MNEKETVIINAALPYSEFPSLHLGHIYGNFLLSDISARTFRKQNYNTIFVSGTDDNGLALNIQAKKQNTSVNELLKFNTKSIKEQLKNFDISFDVFKSTSNNQEHDKFVQERFLELTTKEQETEISMCSYCELQLAQKTIIFFCKKCNENIKLEYLTKHNEKNLNMFCSICKNSILKTQSREFFLKCTGTNYYELISNTKINKSANNILKEIEQKKQNIDCWKLISRNSISGINIPNTNKTFYVWFDAILSYASFLNIPLQKAKNIYFMGKDNVFFHTFFFAQVLPKERWPNSIYSRNWLITEQGKFSKSENNGIFLRDVNKKQTSILRIFLFQLNSEDSDVKFNMESLKEYEKNVFINKILNLFQRIHKLLIKKGLLIFQYDFNNEICDIFCDFVIKQDFKLSYGFFINQVEEANYLFNKEKMWNFTQTNDFFDILNRLLNIFSIISILTPEIINNFSTFFIFNQKEITILDNSNILYTQQFV